MEQWHVGLLIFIFVYFLISARRLGRLSLDRPAVVFLGSVALVAAGVLSPNEALLAVNGEVLLLLFSVMGIGAFLSLDGFWDWLGHRLIAWWPTPKKLLGGILWSSAALSAFLTNDTVCLLGASLVLSLIRRYSLPALPFLLTLATAANTGSALTLIGNPQNMLCAVLGDLSFFHYFKVALPVTIAALFWNHFWIFFLFRKNLSDRSLSKEENAEHALSSAAKVDLVVLAGMVIGCLAGLNLAWTAAGAFGFLLIVRRRESRLLWAKIDWPLLLFFAGLFIVVEAVRVDPWVEKTLEQTKGWNLETFESCLKSSLFFLVGSNLVSNVPFILVIEKTMNVAADPRPGWTLLALVSTFAGNLTFLGSVANVIVGEQAKDVFRLGFRNHWRVGIPVALGSTFIAAIGVFFL